MAMGRLWRVWRPVENTSPWAKAGVMIRENLTAGSRHAIMALTPAVDSAFQRRVNPGDISLSTSGGSTFAPAWVKLVRNGNIFSGYQSSDGVNWALVSSETISMASSVYLGLAVTSTNTAALCTATFDSVVVSRGGSNYAAGGEHDFTCEWRDFHRTS